jgi:transcriptional regulator with XRE-family HTH domain
MLGMSQEDLAEELGCSRELVSAYEARISSQSYVPDDFLLACAAYFKTRHDDIVKICESYKDLK